jgi:hypothetical protein
VHVRPARCGGAVRATGAPRARVVRPRPRAAGHDRNDPHALYASAPI